jgi:site-specific DNA recombinase
LDELAKAYAAKAITMREWLTAKKPIEERKEAAGKRLARLTRGDALTGLVGNGATLRAQWATLNLTRQAAIIATVVDCVRIAPAAKAANRMDEGRVEVVWRA